MIGSGPYTDGSSICAAAVHAGWLRAAAGGEVTIEIRPGAAHYAGSEAHYVTSANLDAYWSGSFLVTAPEAPALTQPPGAPPAPNPQAAEPGRARGR